ncbi:MAG TPA: NTP transferase domain-containing protein, partial [Bryobacteraceae bacterium]|nr:NTP transferase domain-containing protein [Bryobacteraceae bacterium]
MSDISQPGPRICGLILAAGASRRMGTSKALLTVGGETFLDRLIGLLSVVCEPVIVVTGHDALQAKDGMFVTNPEPERGMLSSLQCGLRAVPAE